VNPEKTDMRDRILGAWVRTVLGSTVLLAFSAGLAGCSERGFSDIFFTDIFQQSRVNQLDLLVVIDNSCSMVEEQGNLAGNFDQLIDTFATAEVDWTIAVTTTDVEADRFRGLLVTGDDEIILRGPAGEVARAVWDRNWVFEEGVALQLDAKQYTATAALALQNWCPAASEYTEGHRGSPGAWNAECSGTKVDPPVPGEDAGPRAPRYGEILITEVMARAKGPDSTCEWFELSNRTTHTLKLDGVTVGDQGNNLASFPDGLVLPPYGVLVVGRSLDPELNCDVPVDVAVTGNFALHDNVPVLSAATEDADELFAEKIAQGTLGSGIEHGLEGARLTIEEPFYTEANGAWLREDAAFAVLIVSDEDDVSPLAVHEYERAFKEIKGDRAFRQDGWFTLNAVVGTVPTDNSNDISCSSDNGVAYFGSRYVEFASRTGGVVESICAQDFSPVVRNLGLSISGLDVTFTLRRRPVLDSLEVKLFEDRDESSFVRDLVAGEDFEYIEEGNYLQFKPEQVPPPEFVITAKYRPLSTSSQGDAAEQAEDGE
jgi:hypothetical protein